MATEQPNRKPDPVRVVDASFELPPTLENQSEDNRRKKIGANGLIALIMAVLAGASSIYFGFIQSDRYLVEVQFAIRQVDNNESSFDGVKIPILNSVTSSAKEDAAAAIAYITSWQSYHTIDKKLKLSKHIQDTSIDYISRISPTATKEDKLKKFKNLINASFNPDTNLTTITIASYTPEMSQNIAALILKRSEEFVNNLSKRIAEVHLKFVRTELASRVADYRRLRNEIVAYQTRLQMLDPETRAKMLSEVLVRLEADVLSNKAQLQTTIKLQSARSAKVKELRELISAKEAEIVRLRHTLVAGDDSVAVKAALFRQKKVDAKFAEEAYKLALTTYEKAKIEVARRAKVLAVVVAPTMPEEALAPDRWLNIATVLGLCLLAYGIIMVFMNAIKEQTT